MFIVGKLFTYTFLPPGSIIIALAVAAILLVRRKRILESTTLFALAALIYLASIQPVTNLLLAPLEKAATRGGSTEEPELIVVLGGGAIAARFATPRPELTPEVAPELAKGDAAATTVSGNEGADNDPQVAARLGFRVLSGDSIARTSEGAALHLETRLPVAVTGGSPLAARLESEAAAAKRYLIRLGVPPGEILVEGESRNTWENARFVANLSDARSIYLVTSAFHIKRSIECFVANGFEVTPVATYFRVGRGKYTFWDYAPKSSSFSDSILALHEFVGRFYYRLRYGSGGYRFLGAG